MTLSLRAIVAIIMLTPVIFVHPALAREAVELPAVPDSLRTPADRADFILAHFWDAMDWSAPEAASDTLAMEQDFVNYLSVVPYTSPGSIKPAFRSMVKAASTSPRAYMLLLKVAERYLYEPESPDYNEAVYMALLEEIIDSATLDRATLSRYKFQLEEVSKNRPGQPATDFPIILADGTVTTLLQQAALNDSTLLIFFDPDCDHCRSVIESLAAKLAYNNGATNVITVYFEGDESTWNDIKSTLPSNWINGFTPDDPIEEDELYALRRMPTMYLLDRKGIILEGPIFDFTTTNH